MAHTEQSWNAAISIADCGDGSQMFKEISTLECIHCKQLEETPNGYVSMENPRGETTYQKS